MGISFTPDQQSAIDARHSSILVSAAAGSGKTAVLVERIMQLVTDPAHPTDVDHLLVVTFTQAAAAQMREKIAAALQKASGEHPEDAHLARQQVLVHNAQITTIDSFCLYLIRNYFDRIGLDPDFRVADEAESKLLGQEVLEQLLEDMHEEASTEFLHCVEFFSGEGGEQRLEEEILNLYHFCMSYPWPEEWLKACQAEAAMTSEQLLNTKWVQLLEEETFRILADVKAEMKEALAIAMEEDGPEFYQQTIENELAHVENIPGDASLETLYTYLHGVGGIFDALSRKKSAGEDPLKRKQAKDLRDNYKKNLIALGDTYYAQSPERQLELMEKTGPAITMLCRLVLSYIERFAEQKREKHLIDFSDMEHLALQILSADGEEEIIDGRTMIVGPAARELREQFAEIMIDEYQDSNLVQEYLLTMVSGEAVGRHNRFMVGDVKQSIYKFRLARPELFMEKFDTYERQAGAASRRIDLRQNFRSRTQVTDAVNEVFERIMKKDLGGVEYDSDAALYPGASYPNANESDDPYQAEVLLVIEEEGADKKEREALMIAQKIRSLVGHLQISEEGKTRPAQYRDVVILMRTMSGWDEAFAKVLRTQGIPCHMASRTGYYSTGEVQVVLNILRILQNPLQDIPLFGVLHSPIGGFTDEEMAWIRAGRKKMHLYDALKEIREEKDNVLQPKVCRFLDFLNTYRELAEVYPIRVLLEKILEETGYLRYAAALPGGEQREANLEMLLVLADNFQKTSYYGLFHFLRYVEQSEKYEIDYGEASLQDENADAVRIMSIHKSKGLEFPICFVCGMHKQFNMKDTTRPVLTDMDLLVASDYIDPVLRYKSKTWKKAILALKQKRDSLGEELRVLYVAMTRAKEKLILTGSINEDKMEKLLQRELAGERSGAGLTYTERCSAAKYLDWLAPAWLRSGRDISFVSTDDLLLEEMDELRDNLDKRARLEELLIGGTQSAEQNEMAQQLAERFRARYPHEHLSNLYAKASVSELKMSVMQETDEEAYRKFETPEPAPYLPLFMRTEEQKIGGAVRGSAYHRFLELTDLTVLSEKEPGEELESYLRDEIDRLQNSGRMEPEYKGALSVRQLAKFASSEICRRMGDAQRRGTLKKEQPFVIGVPASTLEEEFSSDETILVQGIIDVFWAEEDGLVVADYKTDSVQYPEELSKRYREQLRIYADALTQITGIPVKERILYSLRLGMEIPV